MSEIIETPKTEIIGIKKNREYYNNFINKNKDKLNETKQCEICLGRYKYMNKSHHNKTALHLSKTSCIIQ